MDRRINDNKIEELEDMIKAHITNENARVEELHEKMDELIVTIKPIVDIYNKSNGFFETVTWILKTSAMIGAGVAAIIYLIKIGK